MLFLTGLLAFSSCHFELRYMFYFCFFSFHGFFFVPCLLPIYHLYLISVCCKEFHRKSVTYHRIHCLLYHYIAVMHILYFYSSFNYSFSSELLDVSIFIFFYFFLSHLWSTGLIGNARLHNIETKPRIEQRRWTFRGVFTKHWTCKPLDFTRCVLNIKPRLNCV